MNTNDDHIVYRSFLFWITCFGQTAHSLVLNIAIWTTENDWSWNTPIINRIFLICLTGMTINVKQFPKKDITIWITYLLFSLKGLYEANGWVIYLISYCARCKMCIDQKRNRTHYQFSHNLHHTTRNAYNNSMMYGKCRLNTVLFRQKAENNFSGMRKKLN